ncbi:MAG: hypothetical protein H7Y59_14075 [Anaerolineales bacterium]|nr:hypothetical protein [Anaerolineales bacterium]
MEEDIRYLNLLAVFHIIVAGIVGLLSCLPLINLFIGVPMLEDVPYALSQGEFFSQSILAPLMFILLPSGMAVIGWMLAVAIALNGYYLKNRKWLKYCMVISGIETIFMPFGTTLGVFTIILLTKPNIKNLFDKENSL